MMMKYFWQEVAISSLGPLIGAVVGGIISLLIAMCALKRENVKDVGELLLILRENRKKMQQMFLEIEELRSKSGVNTNEHCQCIDNVVCNKENRLVEVDSVWKQKRALVYTQYGNDNYNCLQNLVVQFDFLMKLQSWQIKHKKRASNDRENCGETGDAQSVSSEENEESKALVDPWEDINCQKFFDLYYETEELFDKIPSKSISERLKVK